MLKGRKWRVSGVFGGASGGGVFLMCQKWPVEGELKRHGWRDGSELSCPRRHDGGDGWKVGVAAPFVSQRRNEGHERERAGHGLDPPS